MEHERPKKWLGQHFLTSQAAIHTTVNAGNLASTDTVLEVGPGRGALTHALLEHAGHVVAVEKDPALATELERTFSKELENGRLRIVVGDILELTSEELGLVDGDFKVVANIPYYITGRFLRNTLASESQPTLAVIIVQKEVAERIARNTKESILSLSVKLFGSPHYVKTIKAGSFLPPPDIDSAILCIDGISRSKLDKKEEGLFFSLLKAGFSQKRKQIGGNLSGFASKQALLSALAVAEIDPTTRAEDIELSKWIALTRALSSKTRGESAYPQTA